jgi:hypothetical protein
VVSFGNLSAIGNRQEDVGDGGASRELLTLLEGFYSHRTQRLIRTASSISLRYFPSFSLVFTISEAV